MSRSTAYLTPLAYELPPAPKMVMDSWLTRLQAIALVTVLLAGVQSQLISGMPEDGKRASDTALRFFAYGGLFFNLGGTLSAVLLLLAIAAVPVTALHLYISCRHGYPYHMFRHGDDLHDPARDRGGIQDIMLAPDGALRLLRAFGLVRGWDLILIHCMASSILGCVFTILQITFAAWIAERRLVAALILLPALLSMCPPLYVFVFLMNPHECAECTIEARARYSMSNV